MRNRVELDKNHTSNCNNAANNTSSFEAFNSHFVNTGILLSQQLPQSPEPFDSYFLERISSTLDLRPVSESELLEIKSCKIAPGYDGLPMT